MPAAIFGCEKAGGVEGSAVGLGMPFVFGEAAVIAGVDDGVFSLGERYAAEGAAEADTAIENRQASENLGEPEWYVKSNLDVLASAGRKPRRWAETHPISWAVFCVTRDPWPG